MENGFAKSPSVHRNLGISERWIHTFKTGEVSSTKGSKEKQCIGLENYSERSVKGYEGQDEDYYISE